MHADEVRAALTPPERPGAGGEPTMSGKVAVITGGSQGIGAGLVAGYRRWGWSVVTGARTITPAEDPDVLTVSGDIAEPATADRIISAALDRFGRIDTLVNNAGVFIAKPFTDYTPADYATVVGVNLTGFFWVTQRAVAEMATRYGGHVVNVSATLAEVAALRHCRGAGRADQGRPGRGHQVAGHRVRLPGHPGQRRLARHHPDPRAPVGQLRLPRRRLPPLGRPGQVSDVVDGVCSWSPPRTSPARSCTSTAARSPVTDVKRAEPKRVQLVWRDL